MLYGAVLFQLTNSSFDDCENVCTHFIIIIKSEVWITSHYLLLGYATMVCVAYVLLCFYIFIKHGKCLHRFAPTVLPEAMICY